MQQIKRWIHDTITPTLTYKPRFSCATGIIRIWNRGDQEENIIFVDTPTLEFHSYNTARSSGALTDIVEIAVDPLLRGEIRLACYRGDSKRVVECLEYICSPAYRFVVVN